MARKPHSSERHTTILRKLRQSGTCAVADLAGGLQVSRETIRRDIKTLEMEGLVKGVHGGVILPDSYQGPQEPAFRLRMEFQAQAKQQIANQVLGYIQPGDSIVLDSGSTNIYTAYALEGLNDLLVITNNMEIARILGAGNDRQVYLCGGHFRADDGAVFGRAATDFLEQFRVRRAILSIGGISCTDGLLDFAMEEAEFARAAIRRADSVVVVADHTKFGRQASIRVGSFDQVSTIITDRAPPPSFSEHIAKFENCSVVYPAAAQEQAE